MAIITLTTDLGFKDFYLSAIKGTIYTCLPQATIADISHQIASFNIAQAAYILKNSYQYFPKGTIHVIGVDTGYDQHPRFLAVYAGGHYFIGPDNGLFSLILDEKPEQIIEIGIAPDTEYNHFPLQHILVKAACRLASGEALERLGQPAGEVNYRTVLQPIREPDLIRGSVIYVDSFQNVITNITRPVFNEVGKGRGFTLYFRRNETIESLSTQYNEVPEGEKLCLFGITGHLEIAINKGKASSLLGLPVGEIIRIEFE